MGEGFDWFKGFILPYTNFVIFLGLAYFLFGKTLRRFAANRKDQYEKAFEEAKQLKDQAEFQARQVKERLDNLDDEVAQILANAKTAAEQEAKALIDDANRLAEHIREEAHKVAETEFLQAKADLQQEIISQVTESVSQKLSSDLDESKQQEILAAKTAEVAKLDLGGVVKHG